MKKNQDSLGNLIGEMPAEVQIRTKLSVSIANKIESLIRREGMTKKQFADSMGKRPSEITKWLSGEHNFTIATLARLNAFFGEPIILVPKDWNDDTARQV